LGRSFLVCRIAGVPLRAHWSLFLLPLYFLYGPLVSRSGSGLLDGLVAMVFLLVAVLCHETAHAAAARGVGAGVRAIVLWPLGGWTALRSVPPPRSRVLLALSGPFANLALAGLASAGMYAPASARGYLLLFAEWNVLLGLFNLVPAPPLDGGEALRSFLHTRLGAARGDVWSGRIGIVAGVGLTLFGLLSEWVFVAIVGVVAIASSVMLLRRARFGAGVGAPGIPETGDFRVWRLPKEELDVQIERKQAAGRADRDMRARVDGLLKQISEKGFRSLTEEDRLFLRRASRHLREQRR